MSKYGVIFLISFVFFWAIGFGLTIRDEIKEKERLTKQCMDLGHPEFECRSLRFH